MVAHSLKREKKRNYGIEKDTVRKRRTVNSEIFRNVGITKLLIGVTRASDNLDPTERAKPEVCDEGCMVGWKLLINRSIKPVNIDVSFVPTRVHVRSSSDSEQRKIHTS